MTEPVTIPFFWTMWRLVRFHENRGFHFFTANNKRYHNSRIQTTPPYKGRVFVTSERINNRWPRRYSVRYIDDDGVIMTVNGFMAFESRYDAHAYAKAYAAENFERVGLDSVRLPTETKMV